MLPVVLGLHVVWRELVRRQILTGVDGACRRRICELSSGGCRGVLDVSHAPTSDGGLIVMRMRYSGSMCGCLLRGGRAGSGHKGNLSDSCGYCSDPWCAAALMPRGCAPHQSLTLIHSISF